mmetsp:Transcript_34308/g.41049  ORF Transcript_34308/g.41049 Transcript_34308/m.41049 type:complete len:103 (-) Transcript_34308:441-749(-)
MSHLIILLSSSNLSPPLHIQSSCHTSIHPFLPHPIQLLSPLTPNWYVCEYVCIAVFRHALAIGTKILTFLQLLFQRNRRSTQDSWLTESHFLELPIRVSVVS